MKLFSDCSGEYAICGCAGFCLAGHGDDYFCLASAEQIIERLQKGQYSSYKNLMVGTLKARYDIDYQESSDRKEGN